MSPSILIYRVGNWFYLNRMSYISKLFSYLNRLLFSVWLPSSAIIGKNFKMGYFGLGTVIHSATKVGNNCQINQNVTIGRNFGDTKVPVLGNDVYVGAGSVIFGEISIGNNVMIGSNSVVNKSIPDNCTVVGNPFRIISHNRSKKYYELDNNIKKIKEIPNSEIVHYFDNENLITSKFNIVSVIYKNYKCTIKLPITFLERVVGISRLSRRTFRLDKCNVFVSESFLILIRKYKVYSYNLKTNELKETLKLKNCRNILHQSLCKNRKGELFFGEYGHNNKRKPVNIYKSSNNGQSWEIIYQFKSGEVKHIHGCYYDKYEDKIWTLTGDFDNENILMKSDFNFIENIKIGNGAQTFRAVSIIFRPNTMHWIMDSPLEKSYHVIMDRKTLKIKKKQGFPGPVWYLKELSDGYVLAASSVEIGEGVYDNYAHLFISDDLQSWTELTKFKKDKLPMRYFKWGVIAFAEGEQSRKSFALFFEALCKVDGKAFIYELDD